MTNEEYAIKVLKDIKNHYQLQAHGFQFSLDTAIKALEKQKAISELQPPTDDWETYADRLYDLAYLSGYNDGLIAKRGE